MNSYEVKQCNVINNKIQWHIRLMIDWYVRIYWMMFRLSAEWISDMWRYEEGDAWLRGE